MFCMSKCPVSQISYYTYCTNDIQYFFLLLKLNDFFLLPVFYCLFRLFHNLGQCVRRRQKQRTDTKSKKNNDGWDVIYLPLSSVTAREMLWMCYCCVILPRCLSARAAQRRRRLDRRPAALTLINEHTHTHTDLFPCRRHVMNVNQSFILSLSGWCSACCLWETKLFLCWCLKDQFMQITWKTTKTWFWFFVVLRNSKVNNCH